LDDVFLPTPESVLDDTVSHHRCDGRRFDLLLDDMRTAVAFPRARPAPIPKERTAKVVFHH
jgi:hypothetical protein